MSVSWTKEQHKVIELQNCNILVSAAAGSGKTAVLVERIITMLTRAENPVDVDKLLIVTFTEAAAAEMKERIRNAIENKLMENPKDEHLQQQATLIHNARITTIHSFCLSVIRDHFHTVGLDPGFRIGEEGELKLCRHDIIKEVLEEAFENGEEMFLEFAEVYSGKRDDRKLEDLILRLYEFSRSYPDAGEWLQSCLDNYKISSEEKLDTSLFMKAAEKNIIHYLKDAQVLLERGLAICQEADGPYMYEETLWREKEQIEGFKKLTTYGERYKAASEFVWGRIAANRDKSVSSDKAAEVKACRDEAKNIVKEMSSWYFFHSPDELIADMEHCHPMMQVLITLVGLFAEKFEEKKRSQNVIDFDDMEQYALRILTEKTEGRFVPSKAAIEYQNTFAEIMIDEYQDSNLIQESILTSVSNVSKGVYNIFMVGDVKQSIYRFRLSRPELFMEKFETYSVDEGYCQRIDLSRNFRSRKEVLESVNYIFYKIMTKELGGILYDENVALYPGAAFEQGADYSTEIIMVDPEIEGLNEGLLDREAEARVIAGRIKELIKNGQVTDKKSGVLRPVKYSDIVILTRSIKGWSDVFAKVLNREGIPAHTGTKEGYFETREIGILLDYLRVLNNSHQDIPLAAVLSSSFGNLTDEELAEIKSTYQEYSFHQAVKLYAAEGKDDCVKQKVKRVMEQMDTFRGMIPYMAIHELLLNILDKTGYLDYVSALSGGEQRKANVEMLVEKALSFETTSYKGLFHFVRYIEQLQKYDIDYGEASLNDEQSDTVRMMSIHKSKGLEFPVVIAAGMGKRFNQQDIRESIVLHAGLGAGLDAVDIEKRTKIPSFIKRVIQREEKLESMGEELRILYVAFTRAKEKLIITGILKQANEKMESYKLLLGKEEKVGFTALSKASTYWDWILPALVHVPEEVPVRVYRQGVEEVVSEEIEEELKGRFTRQTLENWNAQETYDEQMKEHLRQQFSFTYPFPHAEEFQLKFTVSELKKRKYLEEESGQVIFDEPEELPLIPEFRKEVKTSGGAFRGSAYHRVMELLDMSNCYKEHTLKSQMDTWLAEGKLSKEEAEAVQLKDIIAFLDSSYGSRMREAAQKGKLWKEQPFVLGVDMKEIYSESSCEELILVQGIIDVYFEEGDGIVVLDYKTDQIYKGEKLMEKYKEQLIYYGRALERITGKTVKERVIYSFALQESIID